MDLSQKLGDESESPETGDNEPMAIKRPKRHPGEYLLRLDVLVFFGYGGPNVSWSKVAILGMVIQPLIGNPYNGAL